MMWLRWGDTLPPSEHERIRRLDRGDWRTFRRLMAHALTEEPQAFHGSPRRLASIGASTLRADLMTAHVLVAEAGGHPLGMVRLLRGQVPEKLHDGVLSTLYVEKSARGKGVATRLLQAGLHSLGPDVLQLRCEVFADNAGALAFYRAAGFHEYGRMPRSRRTERGYQDAILMLLEPNTCRESG